MPPSPAATPRLQLRLMGTSDLHANIFAYDYYRDRPDDRVGLARTAGLIATARAEAQNSILLDNGDIIQGTPLGDYVALAKGLKKGDIHPMIAAMNVLGYAACTLGNHEFNYGLDFLDVALAGANFPAVCCNIFKPDGSFYVQPWLVLERTFRDEAGAEQKLRVGIIGFTPPQIMQWDQSHLAGRVTTTGIAEAARLYLPKLRARGGHRRRALPFRHIAQEPAAAGRRKRRAGAGAGSRHRRVVSGPSASAAAGRGFRRDRGRRRRARVRFMAFPPSCRASGAAISG